MKWILGLLGIVGVTGDAIPQNALGAYNAIIPDLVAVQLTLHSNETCDFEFVLKLGQVPEFWTLRGMDVEFNSSSHTLSFLNRNESNYPQLFDIRKSVKSFGSFETPIVGVLLGDGRIVAEVMGLPVELSQGDRLDMHEVQENFLHSEQEKYNTNHLSVKYFSPLKTVAPFITFVLTSVLL